MPQPISALPFSSIPLKHRLPAFSLPGVLICGTVIVLMLKTKLPTTAVLLGSAAAGALLAAFF